jgi:sulfoxide reductase heme-binding subunit YedZ
MAAAAGQLLAGGVVSANDLWFTARGAGLSAMLTLTLATVLGALGSVRTRSSANRVVAQYLHRTAAVLGLLLILLHVSTLILDPKAHIGLSGALVPFAAHYRPNAVALGSIGAYLFAVVAALGAARGRMAGSRVGAASWRALHSMAYVAWGIAVTHGILAGTDRGQNWVILFDILCIGSVVMAVAVRLAWLDAEPDKQPARAGPGNSATWTGRR